MDRKLFALRGVRMSLLVPDNRECGLEARLGGATRLLIVNKVSLVLVVSQTA